MRPPCLKGLIEFIQERRKKAREEKERKAQEKKDDHSPINRSNHANLRQKPKLPIDLRDNSHRIELPPERPKISLKRRPLQLRHYAS